MAGENAPCRSGIEYGIERKADPEKVLNDPDSPKRINRSMQKWNPTQYERLGERVDPEENEKPDLTE